MISRYAWLVAMLPAEQFFTRRVTNHGRLVRRASSRESKRKGLLVRNRAEIVGAAALRILP